MDKVYAARTLPVNPPDAPFIITHDVLWRALQRKIRRATEFVPSMRDCNVVSDKDGVVVRDCVLQHPNGALRPMQEEVTSIGKQWIIFRQREGSVTTNLISNGANNNDGDMQLTYFFEWNYPDISVGTKEHEEAIEMTSAAALLAVQQSIITTRQLYKEGVITEGGSGWGS